MVPVNSICIQINYSIQIELQTVFHVYWMNFSAKSHFYTIELFTQLMFDVKLINQLRIRHGEADSLYHKLTEIHLKLPHTDTHRKAHGKEHYYTIKMYRITHIVFHGAAEMNGNYPKYTLDKVSIVLFLYYIFPLVSLTT